MRTGRRVPERRSSFAARSRSFVLPAVAGVLLALPTCATAEPWGGALLLELVTWPLIVAGLLGLFLSAVLGAAASLTALRAKLDSASKVFARGFLGVSAVVVFFVSAFLLVLGLTFVGALLDILTSIFATIGLALLFLAVEFGIAALLYLRVRQRTRGRLAAVLGWSCAGLSAVIALLALGSFLMALSTSAESRARVPIEEH